MVEREGTPEEEEIAPFEVIDDVTIKHFSHDHNLRINKNGHILSESIICVACAFQICSEPFYSCEHCDFVLHEKCAYLPRKKRHACNNLVFTLFTDAPDKTYWCNLCFQGFSGFRYTSIFNVTIDVRCASTSDSLESQSHQHLLYFHSYSIHKSKCCAQCGNTRNAGFSCSKCAYFLDAKCAILPKKVTRKRYDDHPLFLCFGEKNAESEYWCEACETKVDPRKWFYTCKDFGITLHIGCVVGDFSHIMPGSVTGIEPFATEPNGVVVSNNFICRKLCSVCKSRCKHLLILKLSKAGDDVYICSFKCC